MGIASFFSLLAVVAGLIAFWFRKKYSYFEERGFVYEKPEFPFGCLRGVGSKFHFSQKSKRVYDAFRGKAKVVGLYFFTAPAVFVLDLDTVKHVLVKDFSNFHDRGLYYNTKSDPLSGHLFAIEGETKTSQQR